MLNFRLAIAATALAVCAGASASGQALPPRLELALPRYELAEHESLHYVRIPGGQLLLEEEGRPRVPYFIEYLDCPKGARVRDVILEQRSDAEETTGLRLPVVILDMQRKSPVAMKAGLYPDRKHSWRVVDLPDGTSRLAVAVYPFNYDPKTTDVTYCRRYSFGIEYVRSAVTLAGLAADAHSYAPAGKVGLTLEIENAGETRDVSAKATIVRASTGEQVAQLPARSVAAGPGSSPVTLEWSARGVPNGDYYADAAVTDAEGTVLDRRQVSFRLGIPEAELTSFEVIPAHFRVGEPVKLRLNFRNTGSTSLSGQAVFEVRTRDSVVLAKAQDFKDLPPGRSRQAAESWNTSGAEKNALYSVIGYVLYEATATTAERIVVSTNASPSAEFTVAPDTLAAGQEVRFDAGGSRDPDGTIAGYRWDFGDGGEAEGVAVNHAYAEPGEFIVTLTVTDDGGRAATAVRTIAVGE
ncbi:MAG: PKD domain-containing protein [bacterium]